MKHFRAFEDCGAERKRHREGSWNSAIQAQSMYDKKGLRRYTRSSEGMSKATE